PSPRRGTPHGGTTPAAPGRGERPLTISCRGRGVTVPRDAELAFWSAVPEPPRAPDGTRARAAELRTVVRRLRRPGGVSGH
ncbi:hypothetical protein, partial [Streptomyces sp. NPDC055692]|uniref:hypothetical protein n=1 Tax=Streptomyces sp. NPDC055692 TaxID=3155683 RepID=UPI00342C5D85